MGGRKHLVHEDGTSVEAGPEAVYIIEPGHDAWVVEGGPVVRFEFESAKT